MLVLQAADNPRRLRQRHHTGGWVRASGETVGEGRFVTAPICGAGSHHMTYEQLEYVARAIFCADARGGLREWLAIDQDHRNYYMRLAKAAADAMPRT